MFRQCNPLHHPIRYSGVLLAALGAAIAAVVLATAPPAGTSGARDPTSLFDYDRSAPLELAWGKTAVSHKVAHQDLKFSAGKHARVAAYFVHPMAGAPWPLVRVGGTRAKNNRST